jgi:hypothetical protein
LSGLIAASHGNRGNLEQQIDIRLNGTAGQSLGVWLAGSVNLHLTGDANDYVGKGMAGGKIVIRPHGGTAFKPEERHHRRQHLFVWRHRRQIVCLGQARASALACAIPAPAPWWKALATTAANT